MSPYQLANYEKSDGEKENLCSTFYISMALIEKSGIHMSASW
jgi:hypothetical protein